MMKSTKCLLPFNIHNSFYFILLKLRKHSQNLFNQKAVVREADLPVDLQSNPHLWSRDLGIRTRIQATEIAVLC